MSDLDATFRCTHFACTLAVRHCLRRQAETRRKPGRTSVGKHFVRELPVHPHCASGTCEQGNANAAAHPEFTHQQHDPRTTPRLDIVRAAEESTMAKTLCADCRSPSKHLAGCAKSGKRIPASTRPPAATAPAPAAKAIRPARRPAGAPNPEDMSVEELLELRAGIDQVLRDRRKAAEAQLRALDAALDAPTAVRSVG